MSLGNHCNRAPRLSNPLRSGFLGDKPWFGFDRHGSAFPPPWGFLCEMPRASAPPFLSLFRGGGQVGVARRPYPMRDALCRTATPPAARNTPIPSAALRDFPL